MNIKITKEEHEFLQKHVIETVIIGSHMYKLESNDSDKDFLCIYRQPLEWNVSHGLPNIHQLQYDDDENNIDYIYTEESQYLRNLQSGDSTINADVILFSNDFTTKQKLEMCRTFKIIKAYIGFANRDLRALHRDESKYNHIVRGLFTAESLMDNHVITIDELHKVINEKFTSTDLRKKYVELRVRLTKMHNSNELPMYFIPKVKDSLFQKILDSNNIKEFKYD